MVTKEQVVEALEGIVDPFLHKTLKETSAIKEVTVKPEKEHVSVKIAIVKTGTAEQMQLQSGIVKLVKRTWGSNSWTSFCRIYRRGISSVCTGTRRRAK